MTRKFEFNWRVTVADEMLQGAVFDRWTEVISAAIGCYYYHHYYFHNQQLIRFRGAFEMNLKRVRNRRQPVALLQSKEKKKKKEKIQNKMINRIFKEHRSASQRIF